MSEAASSIMAQSWLWGSQIAVTKKSQKFIKSKRFTVNTVKAEELGKVDINKKLKVGNSCQFCNENYDIEDCVFFLQQTLEDRSKLLYKRKLCYGSSDF